MSAPEPHGTSTQLSFSDGFAEMLEAAGSSLALTSYETGQLILIGRRPDGVLAVNQQHFDHAMGLAWRDRRLLLASRTQLWRFEDLLDPGEIGDDVHDAVMVPRIAFTTGDLDLHEVALGAQGAPLFVATRFNCLGTPDPRYSFRPVWKPPFISAIVAEDRCHLNGVAMHGDVPKLVTVMSPSDEAGGWKQHYRDGGMLLSVSDGKVMARNLSMPHSPRLAHGSIWLIESGRGWLVRIDPRTGDRSDVAFCPGFARGLSIQGDLAVVTLSRPRGDDFEGQSLDEALSQRGEEARCGLMVINIQTGETPGWVRFDGRIRELFDVVWLPGIRCPTALGPGTEEIRNNIRIDPRLLHSAAGSRMGPVNAADQRMEG